MKTPSRKISIFIVTFLFLTILGCQDASQKRSGPPPITPQEHVDRIYEVGEGLVGRILPARNRSDFLREAREVTAHLAKVEKEIERRNISLGDKERRILRDSRERLASVDRQLQPRRISKQTAKKIYKELDKVHASFGLFFRRYNTSPYQGFLARPEQAPPPSR